MVSSSTASTLAGLFLTYWGLPENHRHKNKIGGILSALTHDDPRSLLFASDARPHSTWTVLAGPLSRPDAQEAVLLPYGITDARAALGAWHALGDNFFHVEGEPPNGAAPTDFIQRFALSAWLATPPMSPQRWAYAAIAYEHAGASHAPSYEEETRRRRAVAQRAATILGAKELDARRLGSQLEDVLIRAVRDSRTLVDAWGSRIPAREPRMLPVGAVSDRAHWGLSIAQALVYHLVEDSTGPRLTHAAAAKTLGVGEERRREISTHLARARTRVAKTKTAPPPASNPLAAFTPKAATEIRIDWNQPLLGAVQA